MNKKQLGLTALILGFPFCSTTLIAQEDLPWLSLNRLSVSISSSYHYRPWTSYNASLRKAQDAVRYDPSYRNPEGSFEKILGDLGIDLSISYFIFEDLSFNVIGGYTGTQSKLDLTYLSSLSPMPSPPNTNVNQELRLGLTEIGGGVRYQQRLAENLHLVFGGTIVSSQLRFLFNYELNTALIDGKHPRTKYSFAATLSDKATSVRALVGLRWSFLSFLSSIAEIDYRWLRFESVRGTGKQITEYLTPTYNAFTKDFNALLGETDGYFGILLSPMTGPLDEHLLHIPLWGRTDVLPYWETRRPVGLDLSGFGVRLGVQFDF